MKKMFRTVSPLVAAVALFTAGCGGSSDPATATDETSDVTVTDPYTSPSFPLTGETARELLSNRPVNVFCEGVLGDRAELGAALGLAGEVSKGSATATAISNGSRAGQNFSHSAVDGVHVSCQHTAANFEIVMWDPGQPDGEMCDHPASCYDRDGDGDFAEFYDSFSPLTVDEQAGYGIWMTSNFDAEPSPDTVELWASRITGW